MGYELNKLMRQFGVSSPTLGIAPTAPVEPVAPVYEEPDSSRMFDTADRSKYDLAKQQYDKDVAALPDMVRRYKLAQDEYDAYKRDYRQRINATPMYTASQFKTNPAVFSSPSNWNGPLTMPTYGAIPKTLMGQNLQQKTDYYNRLKGLGYTDADISAEVSKTFGNLNDPDWQNLLNVTTSSAMANGGAVNSLAKKYNLGGQVRKYRFGGSEGEPADEALIYPESNQPQVNERDLIMLAAAQPETATDAAPVTASPAVKPVALPPAATTPISPAAADLAALMNRYLSTESPYGTELAAARKRVDVENKAFQDLIAQAMKPDGTAPDKTEMYFRLAAAFGSPTKTGKFTENVALAGKELADYAKDVRTAKKAERQLQMQLGLEGQKLKTQAAREELGTLRTLAAEEMKDKRAILQEYIKSGRPQSEAGKAAVDAGLVQGTPEFNTFVKEYIDDKIRSGNLLKEAMVSIAAGGLEVRRAAESRAAESAKKLTPAELKLKSETEDRLTTVDNALRDLSRAYDLNKDSFDSTLKDRATLTILEQTGSKDPKVLNTKELLNLLQGAMISSASEKLKGVLSDSDIKLLQSVSGLDAKSKDERAQILKNAYRALKSARTSQQKRLNEISQGLYRETTPSPSSGEIGNE